jgi:hypothetical protein
LKLRIAKPIKQVGCVTRLPLIIINVVFKGKTNINLINNYKIKKELSPTAINNRDKNVPHRMIFYTGS